MEDFSDKFTRFAAWFIASFDITIFLDAIFGMPPEQPFVDYGCIWILKPIMWCYILLMWATIGKYKKTFRWDYEKRSIRSDIKNQE